MLGFSGSELATDIGAPASAPLRERTLKVIDIGAPAEGAALYIGYPDHLRGSAKIRALTTWLQNAFGNPPHWDRSHS